MKKWIFLSLMLIASKSYASLKDVQVWRATETATADNVVFVATGCPCVIYDITVTSGSPDQGKSVFRYYTSTVTTGFTAVESRFILSTSTVHDIDVTGDRFEPYEVITSSSWGYHKTGTTSIRVRWDYLYQAPKGRERVGLRP